MIIKISIQFSYLTSPTKRASENKHAERSGLQINVGTGSIRDQGCSTVALDNYSNFDFANIHGAKNFINIYGRRNSPTSIAR